MSRVRRKADAENPAGRSIAEVVPFQPGLRH